MTSPLADARAKLGRARVHTQEVETKLRAWIEAQGDRPPFDLEIHEDTAAGCLVFRTSRVDEMPQEWNLIIGDALFNFRSALDYLAWQLVKHGTSPNPKKPEDIGWPIYDDEARFQSSIGRKLPGILDKHRALVETHQPYKTTKLHPLAVLNDLSRQDKHRQIVAVLAAHKDYTIRGPIRGFSQERVVLPSPNKPVAVKFGTELARVYGKRAGDSKPEMYVEFKGTTSIAFDNGIWVLEAFAYIDRRVEKVLLDFEALLP